MTTNLKLAKIADKFNSIQFNEDNYSVGGGLDGVKFASRRHENARGDEGKLTEGEATQLFKNATGLELQLVKEVINYAVPNMEWHHAGKLPKSYGGGMKKTYFFGYITDSDNQESAFDVWETKTTSLKKCIKRYQGEYLMLSRLFKLD